MTVTTLMTAEDLERLPDDGYQYELVRGELKKMAPANPRPSMIALAIGAHLHAFVREHHLGYVTGADGGYILARNPDTVRAPDCAFIEKSRPIDRRGYFRGAPDLAIEVISPSDRYSEVEEKVVEYVEAGTRVVIVVDPAKQTAFIQTRHDRRELTINDSLEGLDVVPGWTLPLRELFS